MSKYIRDVFNDYKNNNNLLDAVVENVTLYKKHNKLNIIIASEKQIRLSEIVSFEDYLMNRFSLDNARVEIRYENVEIEPTVSRDWPNIISYIARKEPFSKAILTNSKLEIEDNNLTIDLAVKGASFLRAKKFDKALEGLLSNIYNKNFVVDFNDIPEDVYKKRSQDDYVLREKQAFEDLKVKNEEDAIRIKEEKKIAKEKAKADKQAQKEFLIKENQNVEAIAEDSQVTLSDKKEEPKEEEGVIYSGRRFPVNGSYAVPEDTKVEDIPMREDTDMCVAIDGEILGGNIEVKEYTDKKNGKEKAILSFNVFDGTSTIGCTMFLDKEKVKDIKGKLSGAKGLRIEGNAKYSIYSREVEVMVSKAIESTGLKKEKRMDNAEVKRVELHMHTQMSQMDAITPCSDLLKRAIDWGWSSIAITDHGVVQSFPDAHKLLGKVGDKIKVLYGVEGYFCPDKAPAVVNSKGQDIDTTYCVFDLETTGISHLTEKITEIGIIKIKNGEIIDTFESFVNPEKSIPPEVV